MEVIKAKLSQISFLTKKTEVGLGTGSGAGVFPLNVEAIKSNRINKLFVLQGSHYKLEKL